MTIAGIRKKKGFSQLRWGASANSGHGGTIAALELKISLAEAAFLGSKNRSPNIRNLGPNLAKKIIERNGGKWGYVIVLCLESARLRGLRKRGQNLHCGWKYISDVVEHLCEINDM